MAQLSERPDAGREEGRQGGGVWEVGDISRDEGTQGEHHINKDGGRVFTSKLSWMLSAVILS